MKTEMYFFLPPERYSDNIIDILNILNKYHVKYSVLNSPVFDDDHSVIGTKAYYTVTAYQEEPAWDELSKYLDRDWAIITYRFTQKEIDSAPWLVFRSDNANRIYNEDDANSRTYEYPCLRRHLCHKVQVGPFELRKKVKWNSGRYFYGSEGMGFGRLFTSSRGREILQDNFNSVSFDPVLKLNSQSLIDDIWQVRIQNALPIEAIVPDSLLLPKICPACGYLQFDCSSEYRLKVYANYLNSENDFYITDPVFSHDYKCICSHDAYARMKALGIERKLIFEPLLIE